MRIIRSQIGTSAYNSQRRNARYNAMNTSNSVMDRLNDRFNTNNSRLNQTKNASQAKEIYTAVQKGAEGVREHTQKLQESGEKSLFAAAKESGNNEKVVEEIKNFTEDYNAMIKKMNASGGSVNKIFADQMENYYKANKGELKEIGISQNADGTLKVDQESLKKADIKKLEKVFGKDGVFGEQIGNCAASVEVNAEAYLQEIKNGTYRSYGSGYGNSGKYGGYNPYSNYNPYGGYNDSYSNYGGYGGGNNFWG